MVYYDYIGLDVVIIIGSPSLGIDAGQHDQNPWNFLNLGLRRAEHAAKACWNAASNSCCCKVYVVIYKPGYERRTAYDIKRGINRDNVSNLTNLWIARLARLSACVEVSYKESGDEVLDFLRSLENGSVDQLDYIGHSTDDSLLIEYGSLLRTAQGVAESRDWIDNSDFINSLEDKFSTNGSFNHMGCYGADCAEEMNERYGVEARGASQKTDYSEAGKFKSPELEPMGMDSPYARKPNLSGNLFRYVQEKS